MTTMNDMLKYLVICASLLLAFSAAQLAHAQVAAYTEMKTVVVLKNNAPRGELITEDNLTTKDFLAYQMPSNSITNKDDLIGKEALRTIRAGFPVLDNYVRIPPDARKGQEITVIYKVPGLELEAMGKALEDGQVGDVIKAVNINSNKIISGVLVAPQTIQVN